MKQYEYLQLFYPADDLLAQRLSIMGQYGWRTHTISISKRKRTVAQLDTGDAGYEVGALVIFERELAGHAYHIAGSYVCSPDVDLMYFPTLEEAEEALAHVDRQIDP